MHTNDESFWNEVCKQNTRLFTRGKHSRRSLVMNLDVVCILCALTLTVPRNVAGGFNLIKEFLFPRVPTVTRLRHAAEARGLGDRYAVLDTIGLIEQFGYPAEEHKVTTEDGYNIDFFRIPGSPDSPAKDGKPAVFLQHGVLASSDSWVCAGPRHDLAFILADAGYDVWIGNVRGNSYARSHTDLSPQDRDFWNFSFHEIAVRDLPTMIDHALKITGQKSLFYIGHSMGTTAVFILLSEKPEYNDRMRLVVALAPVAFWKGAPTPLIRFVTETGPTLKNFLVTNGIYELAPQTTNNIRLGRSLCSDGAITQSACAGLYFLLAGEDQKQLNNSFLPHILSYFPAGASTGTLYHYMQNIMTGVFQKYDLGYTENFRAYGKKKPPMYDVKKISAPVALIYGKNDVVSTEANTIELMKRLQNVAAFEAVPFDNFNHLDFLWAIDAKNLLYNRIMELMAAKA